MKKNKVLASVLCSAMALGSVAPSFAVTGAAVTTAGGTGTADALLTQEATTFSVNVPTVLPVWVDSEGVVTTADNAQIVNNSFGPVTVEAAQLDPINDWGLVAFDSDVESMKVGSKQFGFELQGAAVPTTGECDVSGFNTINGNGSAETIDYNSIVAPQKAAVTEEMANLVFTIGWDELKPTSYNVKSINDLTPSQTEGVNYDIYVGDKVQLEAIAVFSAEAATGWSSDDDEVATVTEDGLVTGVGEGTATITYSNNGVEGSVVFSVTEPVIFITNGTGGITGLTDYGKTLSTIVVPSEIDGVTITDIGQTFRNSSVKEVTLPSTVTTLGDYAFASSGLTTLNAPNVTSVGKYSFAWTNDYKNVVIPDGITALPQGAFMNAKLETLDLNNVKTIAQSAFNNCQNLTSIDFGAVETITQYNAFSYCTSLTNLRFGDNIKEIGAQSFCNCTSLQSVIIPTSVQTLGSDIFDNCGASFKNVYYKGRSSQWNSISKASDWKGDASCTVSYNYAG